MDKSFKKFQDEKEKMQNLLKKIEDDTKAARENNLHLYPSSFTDILFELLPTILICLAICGTIIFIMHTFYKINQHYDHIESIDKNLTFLVKQIKQEGEAK